MNDADTTVQRLRDAMRAFVAERQWEKYHTPKNLAMSLAIEAAELMEHFQWLDADEARRVAASPKVLAEVADELADVICYALSLANALDIDLATAVFGKLSKNAIKYPAAQFQGRYRLANDTESNTVNQ